jgi:uncharacterized protein (TIGR00255 family)
MIQSMTGFGKASAEFSDKTITVEVRSLNSKQFDLNLRMPSILREKEIDLRTEVQRMMERGKIDLSVSFEYRTEKPAAVINKAVVKEYHRQLNEIAAETGEPQQNFLSLILTLPEALRQEKKDLNEEEWNETRKVCLHAIEKLVDFRKTEGQSLENDLRKRITEIGDLLEKIEGLDRQRIEHIRNKIKTSFAELFPPEKIDANRFEQELIFYLEKMDITEEKVRLKTHLDYFFKTMKEPTCGRKLNFISQEIGREINTIGSKANDASIQKLVVQMKDELERIKEQSLNIL